MGNKRPPAREEEVDQLLRNARLRDELEPFLDESISLVNSRDMPTSQENEFLESMLAWERAPIVPISHWFDPELRLPSPDLLDGRDAARDSVGNDSQFVRKACRAGLYGTSLGSRTLLFDLSRHSAFHGKKARSHRDVSALALFRRP